MSPLINGSGGGTGGSSPFLDLGLVNSVGLISGPQTIHTPATGDVCVILQGPGGFVAYGADELQMQIGATDDLGASGFPAAVLRATLAATFAGSQDQVAAVPSSRANLNAISTGSPIIAILVTDNNAFPIHSTPPAWAATHVYAADFLILGPDSHVWSTDGGTSGGGIPDFAAHHFGTVADNGMTWTDEGHIPTQGTIHLYAMTGTPT